MPRIHDHHEVEGTIELERLHRHLIARELASARDVLHLACGDGHGSAVLAEAARSVIGVDPSPEAIARAERQHGRANVRFRSGTWGAIPLGDASVDVVVSADPIECHDQCEAMMAEIKRVLRPSGVVVLASACRDDHPAMPPCPPGRDTRSGRHHVERLVRAHFRNAVFYAQRTTHGSGIFACDEPTEIWSYRRHGTHYVAARGMREPDHLIAVASDGEIPRCRAGILDTATDASERAALIKERDAAIEERDAALADREAARMEREALLQILTRSKSWRVTAPLRAAGSALKGLLALVERGARRVYWAAPLPMATKLRIRSFLAGVAWRWRRWRERQGSPDGHPPPRLPRAGSFRPSARFADPRRPFEPLVTVIVPNYNHGAFLRQRLDSVYGQSYRRFRVLLLDDASTDGSRTILEEYVRAHPALTELHVNAVNSGGAFRQWRKGLELAGGDLVWIAESDDYCDPNFLQELVGFFRDEAVKLAYSRTVFVGRDGDPLPFTFENYMAELDARRWREDYVETAHREVRTALGKKNSIPNVSGVLFRKPDSWASLGTETWLDMRLCGDWIFYLHLVRGGKIAFSTRATNYHRFHTDNLTVGTVKTDAFYREHATVATTVARLYNVPAEVLQAHFDITRRVGRENAGTDVRSDRARVEGYDPAQARRRARERRPNILMVGHAFCTGGGEIVPIRLAVALRERGYGVTYFDFHGEAVNPRVRHMLPPDIAVVERGDGRPGIDALLEDFGIDLVHTHHLGTDFHFASQRRRMRKTVKHVVTMHGMYEAQHKTMLDGVLPLLVQDVDRWVYVADKNLAPFKERGLYRADLFVKARNGLTPVAPKPVARESLGIAADSFVVCVASRAIPEKGWREAIEIVSAARAMSGRDIHLLLLGDGPVHEALQDEVLPPYIHLLGYREDPVDYYAMADLGLLPSRFKGESCPLSVIECLMVSRPVVASDIGEVRSMLTSGSGEIAGGLFPLQDWSVPIEAAAGLIVGYARDSQRYAAAQRVARDVAARFTMDSVIEEYEAVYESCLTKGRAGQVAP